MLRPHPVSADKSRLPDDPLDVRALIEEIQATAKEISALEGGALPALSHVPMAPPPRELDDDWDVWKIAPITSHRGLLGLPIVWAKKASLRLMRLHDRELLRGQRAFNAAVREELRQLRESVGRLSTAAAEARPAEPPASGEADNARTDEAPQTSSSSSPASVRKKGKKS